MFRRPHEVMTAYNIYSVRTLLTIWPPEVSKSTKLTQEQSNKKRSFSKCKILQRSFKAGGATSFTLGLLLQLFNEGGEPDSSVIVKV